MKDQTLWRLAVVLFSLCVFALGCSSSSDPLPAQPAQDDQPLPQQSVAPVISAVSIGVADLADATSFYKDVIGMEVLAPGEYPDYLDQEGLEVVVLVSRQDGRGATLVLTHDPAITDTAYYTDNPDKLVFVLPPDETDNSPVDQFYDEILAHGGSEVGDGGTPPAEVEGYPPGVRIGLAYDLNGYLIEMLAFPPEMVPVEITNPYIVGVGIGASNLENAKGFYTSIMGMVHSADLDVPGFMDEVELATPSGARPNMVLMNYEDPKDYSDNPVKLVFKVADAATYFSFIEAQAPDQIVSDLTTLPSGAISGYALDLDGTMLQIVQPAP
jgi:catechol 2,3-dioxygenase-like lactoylglutathione lyase family enzyme